MIDIKANVNKILQNKKLSVKKYCEICKIDRAQFYRFIDGKSLTIKTLERHAECLGVPIFTILLSEEDKLTVYQEVKAKLEQKETKKEQKEQLTCPNCGKVLRINVLAE